MNSLRLVVASALVLAVPAAWAGACCGGAMAMPALITGDDRAQLSLQVKQSSVIGVASSSGPAVFGGTQEQTQSGYLAGAYRWRDRWQAGGEFSFNRAERVTSSREAMNFVAGAGDLTLNVGYEVVPEMRYSSWKPKVFAFLQRGFPTGRSIKSIKNGDPFGAFGRGEGWWALGAHAMKTWGGWDASMSGLVSYFDDTHNAVSMAAAGGYNPSWGRVGASIGPNYEFAHAKIAEKLVWNAVFSIAHMPSSTTSLVLAYSDQTLFGPAHNVTLSRGAMFTFQRRWEL